MPDDVPEPHDLDPAAPVLMAGDSGSGTRVVAEIVRGLGVYIGDTLNRSLDNLWWTTLFKRPDWFYNLDGPGDPAFRRAAETFTAAMRGDLAPTPRRLLQVLRAYRESVVDLRPALSIFAGDGWDPDDHAAWGWKEPNAIVQLPHHLEAWPRMRYVHVIRNGLDMAWSDHTPMYDFWGRHHGIDPPVPDERRPAALLKWWVRANREALAFCQERLPDRHLVVRFEDLCQEPRETVERLDAFLGTDAPEDRLDELAALPRVPDSAGRHRDHDLSVLDADDLDAVEDLGYEVEHARKAQP